MELDRSYQRDLLEALAGKYPERVDWRHQIAAKDEMGRSRYFANLAYLHEHGLVDSEYRSGERYVDYRAQPKITARGMDFLADDGGLSAILGVVTVKLHEDTLKSLIERKIAEASLDPADKSRWFDALRALPADATKHLAMKLVDLGLAHAPDALPVIRTALTNWGML